MPHARRVAKAVLGRGLGQLLEAHHAVAPADGTPVEERPVRLGHGVRTLITPAALAPTQTQRAADSAPAPAIVSPRRSLFPALLAADAGLCVLAAVILCHPALRAHAVIVGLGVASIALAAWLACEAFLLRRRV